MDTVVCPACGKVLPRAKAYLEGSCSSKCFQKNFWNEIVAEKEKHVFINGESYVICKADPKDVFRGFGGRTFNIQIIATGEIISTGNLWYQGEIPEEYRSILCDNARFVNE